MSCKGIVYHTLKSKLPATPCKNKAKDANGFCLQHKRQSETYARQQQINMEMGFTPVNFTVYCDGESTEIRMRNNYRLSSIMNALYHKFNVNDYVLCYNGKSINLDSPGALVDGLTLELILPGG
jgi:hypothetical protein